MELMKEASKGESHECEVAGKGTAGDGLERWISDSAHSVAVSANSQPTEEGLNVNKEEEG